ncbi:MAG: CaiB/BaiF CoA-transferase family protein, partial [Pseudaminobacter sp.]
LAETGADVVRIERMHSGRPFLDMQPAYDLDRHGRAILRIDLKRVEGIETVLRLAERADVLVEGFRPGVMERLGLGPETVAARNPCLVYGRMTGFGQTGPLAERAGHDLTYLAYSGVLHTIGPEGGKPVPPLNLVADYGGGTMFLVTGILAALLEHTRSGKGQVVDTAMVEGAAMLSAPTHAYMAAGIWQDRRGQNLLDGGAPFYDTYETADGRHIAVACLEPQFFAEFARLLPLDPHFVAAQYDRSQWQQMRAAITQRVYEKTRDEWVELFEVSDACVAPVLSLAEAPGHKHNRARQTFAEAGALTRPAPAPRFSRTPATMASGGAVQADAVLERLGLSKAELEALAKSGVLAR